MGFSSGKETDFGLTDVEKGVVNEEVAFVQHLLDLYRMGFITEYKKTISEKKTINVTTIEKTVSDRLLESFRLLISAYQDMRNSGSDHDRAKGVLMVATKREMSAQLASRKNG